jgi:hypothetical protein
MDAPVEDHLREYFTLIEHYPAVGAISSAAAGVLASKPRCTAGLAQPR